MIVIARYRIFKHKVFTAGTKTGTTLTTLNYIMGENISILLPLSQHEERHTLGQTFLAVPLSQLDLEGDIAQKVKL